jgi:hypothetical protein
MRRRPHAMGKKRARSRSGADSLPGAGAFDARPRVQPLSAEPYRFEFTASTELHRKLAQDAGASEPFGASNTCGLAQLFERALDELILKELKCRTGAGRARKRNTCSERNSSQRSALCAPRATSRQRPDRLRNPMLSARFCWRCVTSDFGDRRAARAFGQNHKEPEVERLLGAALNLLTPARS